MQSNKKKIMPTETSVEPLLGWVRRARRTVLKAGSAQQPYQERLFILILQRDTTCPRPQ